MHCLCLYHYTTDPIVDTWEFYFYFIFLVSFLPDLRTLQSEVFLVHDF